LPDLSNPECQTRGNAFNPGANAEELVEESEFKLQRNGGQPADKQRKDEEIEESIDTAAEIIYVHILRTKQLPANAGNCLFP
jgi:hypothetical protein